MMSVHNETQEPAAAAVNAPPVGVSFLLSQVGAHAANCFGERLASLDLKPHDAGILRMLGSNPGLTQQALSSLLGMFPSRLVAVLDVLEKHGFIERRGSQSDRRVYHLHLTKSGRKALAEVGRITKDLENDLFASLNQQEKEKLTEWLRKIVEQQQITPGVHPAYRKLS